MNQLETPVAMIVFNRPETTQLVFDAVAVARPTRLFLIADGPRANRPGEAERCAQVRKIVSAVDWPCEVVTNFALENLGCRPRVVSGINWVFSQVEDAIILEDDCLPDQSFFMYCSELLNRYRHHPQVAFISGFNPLEQSFPFSFSYYYSMPFSFCTWGWATWRRAWQEFDENIPTWPEVRKAGVLELIFKDRKAVAFWSRVFDEAYAGVGPSAWDYQWNYACWTRNWLCVVPGRNLVRNIGMGPQATHTTTADPDRELPAGAVSFPLQSPPAITPWPAYAVEAQRRFYPTGILWKIRRRLLQRFRSPH